MDFEMHVPEAAGSVIEGYQWSRTRGLKYRAYVVTSAFQKNLLAKLFAAEEEAVKNLKVKAIEIKQCDTMHEAINWMKNKGV